MENRFHEVGNRSRIPLEDCGDCGQAFPQNKMVWYINDVPLCVECSSKKEEEND